MIKRKKKTEGSWIKSNIQVKLLQTIYNNTSKYSPYSEYSWRRQSNPLQYSRLENPMDRGAW